MDGLGCTLCPFLQPKPLRPQFDRGMVETIKSNEDKILDVERTNVLPPLIFTDELSQKYCQFILLRSFPDHTQAGYPLPIIFFSRQY